MDQINTLKRLIAEGHRLRAEARAPVPTMDHHDYCAQVRAWFEACRVATADVAPDRNAS